MNMSKPPTGRKNSPCETLLSMKQLIPRNVRYHTVRASNQQPIEQIKFKQSMSISRMLNEHDRAQADRGIEVSPEPVGQAGKEKGQCMWTVPYNLVYQTGHT